MDLLDPGVVDGLAKSGPRKNGLQPRPVQSAEVELQRQYQAGKRGQGMAGPRFRTATGSRCDQGSSGEDRVDGKRDGDHGGKQGDEDREQEAESERDDREVVLSLAPQLNPD